MTYLKKNSEVYATIQQIHFYGQIYFNKSSRTHSSTQVRIVDSNLLFNFIALKYIKS